MKNSLIGTCHFCSPKKKSSKANESPEQSPEPVTLSQPIIINIENISGKDIDRFDVLDAYNKIAHSGWMDNGDLEINGVKITSGNANVTYKQVLFGLMAGFITIGYTYIEMVDGNCGRILEYLELSSKDIYGVESIRIIVPSISDKKDGIFVYTNNVYLIDWFTKFRFNKFCAHSVFRIYLFASENINLASALKENSKF